MGGLMSKKISIFFVLFVLFTAATAYAQTGTAEAPNKTVAVSENTPITDDDDALVMLELSNGSKVIVTIVSQTKDTLMINNPLGTMTVSMPRSKVLNTRKPTDKEMAKLRKLVAAGKPQN